MKVKNAKKLSADNIKHEKRIFELIIISSSIHTLFIRGLGASS